MISFDKVTLPNVDMFPLVEQFIAEGINVCFTVTGNSMWPLIRHKTDSVLLSPLDRPIRLGDIVLAKYSGAPAGYILHRVTSLLNDACVTAGDNCIAMDRAIPMNNIIGYVSKVFRGPRIVDCKVFYWRLLFYIWRVLFPFRKTMLNSLCFIGKIKMKLRASSKKFRHV